jgi:DNA-binding beta-propeller fold protein YncE
MRVRLAMLLTTAVLPAAIVAAPAQARHDDPHGMSRQAGSWTRRSFDLRAPMAATFTSLELGGPPSVPVGQNPSGIAVSDATHTVYVVNQTDDTVSVIDADACNVEHTSGCGHTLATITLGPGGLENGPVAALLSPDGRTLYVSQPGGANELAVIDATTCNAIHTGGCAGGPVTTALTGQAPLGLAEDSTTQTLYVANVGDNTVSVIDGARCNAQRRSGCGQPVAAVTVGSGPVAVGFDTQTQTAYVANIGDDTVSAIDSASCNAQHPSGCVQIPPDQAVGGAPSEIAVSKHGGTVYVANSGNGLNGLVADGNTVSVVDAHACNGGHPAGCSSAPAPVIAVGGGQDDQPQGLATDPRTGVVYLADSNDDTLSVIDGVRCNARRPQDCPQPAPTEQTGAQPDAVAVDPQLHTIYVSDEVDNAIGVVDDRTCAGGQLSGCRPPAVPAAPLALSHALSIAAVDGAEHTAYVEDEGIDSGGPFSLDLIDTNTCNATDTAGCNRALAPASVPIAGFAGDVVVDASTDTVYVDGGQSDVEVIAAASCNAVDASCARTASVPLGPGNSGGPMAIDLATHTLYVGGDADIAVVDTSHCNGQDMSGCTTQKPITFAVAPEPNAINTAPDTLYDAQFPRGDPNGPSVIDVIDTRHCRAGDTADCAGQPASQVGVGVVPDDVAVDLPNHTLYVPDNGSGDVPGELSMIDIAHCSGDDTSGCSTQSVFATPLQRGPTSATLDPATGTLYVTDFSDAAVSLIDTARCNATHRAGCQPVPRVTTVGSGPFYTALDPVHDTLYVPNLVAGTVSLIRTGR